MDRVQVKTNPDSNISSTIDLSTKPWKDLCPENLPPFKMEENLCPCISYPEGIFPGAWRFGPKKQVSRIIRFSNYMEFCRVVKDDTYHIDGEDYLTTRFYEERQTGWDSRDIVQKEGETIGYCLNGDVYGVDQKEEVYDIWYGMVYYVLVKPMDAFIQLQNMLRDGITLELMGANREFLLQLSAVLSNSIVV